MLKNKLKTLLLITVTIGPKDKKKFCSVQECVYRQMIDTDDTLKPIYPL